MSRLSLKAFTVNEHTEGREDLFESKDESLIIDDLFLRAQEKRVAGNDSHLSLTVKESKEERRGGAAEHRVGPEARAA